MPSGIHGDYAVFSGKNGDLPLKVVKILPVPVKQDQRKPFAGFFIMECNIDGESLLQNNRARFNEPGREKKPEKNFFFQNLLSLPGLNLL